MAVYDDPQAIVVDGKGRFLPDDEFEYLSVSVQNA